MRARAARRGRGAPSPRSSSRCPATPTRSAATWAAIIEHRRRAGARRLPRAGDGEQRRRRRARPIRPGPGGRLRARPGRGPQRSLDGRAARAPTGWARGSPGGTCSATRCRGRAERRRSWPASPSWCSPTSTSSRPRASPGTATSWRPPAGCGSGTWSGWPSLLLAGAPAHELAAAAERADWAPPRTLTAVILPGGEGPRRAGLPGRRARCGRPRTCPSLDAATELVVLLVPDAEGRSRPALLRSLDGRDAVVGPPRPWTEVPPPTRGRCGRCSSGSRPTGPARWTPTSGWPTWCCAPTTTRSPTCGRGCSRPLDDLSAERPGEADGDPARLAAAPRTAGADRRRAVRAPADRPLPHGQLRELYGTPARGSAHRAGADRRPGRGLHVAPVSRGAPVRAGWAG